MKRWWPITVALIAGIIIGRLTVEEKVVVETKVEYRTLNTSSLTPSIISEPIGTRKERVKLIYLRENNHLRDSTKKVEGLPNRLDSATVELPIRDYTFSDDSTYTITARGVYVESLPQIEFKPRYVTTTRTETVVRAPRITHGLQLGAGVAYTPKGVQPAVYLGYGLNIRF